MRTLGVTRTGECYQDQLRKAMRRFVLETETDGSVLNSAHLIMPIYWMVIWF